MSSDIEESTSEVSCLEGVDSLSDAPKDSSHLRKKAKPEKRPQAPLGAVFSKVLSTKTTHTEPILSKRKAIERKLAEEELERRARLMLKKEQREARDSAHVIPSSDTANYEKIQRRIATRGVVQLFNAIHQHQQEKEKMKSDLLKKRAHETLGYPESKKDLKQLSKSSFLDLLKTGANK